MIRKAECLPHCEYLKQHPCNMSARSWERMPALPRGVIRHMVMQNWLYPFVHPYRCQSDSISPLGHELLHAYQPCQKRITHRNTQGGALPPNTSFHPPPFSACLGGGNATAAMIWRSGPRCGRSLRGSSPNLATPLLAAQANFPSASPCGLVL